MYLVSILYTYRSVFTFYLTRAKLTDCCYVAIASRHELFLKCSMKIYKGYMSLVMGLQYLLQPGSK